MRIISKIKNVLKKRWITILVVIWALYLVLKYSNEYKVFSILEIFILVVMSFAVGYSIGKKRGHKDLKT